METEFKSSVMRGLCGSMELAWLFAWTLFLISAAGTESFPLMGAGLLFVMAVLAAGHQERTGSRRIWKVSVHALLLTIIIAMAMRSTGLSFRPGSVYDIWQAGLISLIMAGFWYRGVMLGFKKLSYEAVCNRVDSGLAAILGLMFLNLLIAVRGGQPISEKSTLMFAVIFFICAMIAGFLARNSGSGQKKYRKGFELKGVLISTGIVLLLSGTGVWLFFHSGLNQVTRDGYDGFVQAAAPLKPYIIKFLKTILMISGNSPAMPASPGESGNMKWVDFSMPGYTARWIDSAVGYGFAGLAILVLILIAGIMAVALFRWLLADGNGNKTVPSGPFFYPVLIRWFGHLKRLLILCMTRNRDGVVSGYRSLVRWGHRGGVSLETNETPLEYGRRLSERFAPLDREIQIIVHSFCLEVYGRKTASREAVRSVRTAFRIMRHPRYWPLRIKSIFRYRP